MNLEQLIKGLERGPRSVGMQVINEWLMVDETRRKSSHPPHQELDDEVLFCVLARQLAYDCTGTRRVHVQYKEKDGLLGVLSAISIPGSVVQVHRTVKNMHGICYIKSGANMKMMNQVVGFASPCFVSSGDESAVFVSRLAEGDEIMVTDGLIEYARDMQAIGALIHAAIGRGEIKVNTSEAEGMGEEMRGYYRNVLGVQDGMMDLEMVQTMARELAIWRAAGGIMRGGVVGQEVGVGREEWVFVLFGFVGREKRKNASSPTTTTDSHGPPAPSLTASFLWGSARRFASWPRCASIRESGRGSTRATMI